MFNFNKNKLQIKNKFLKNSFFGYSNKYKKIFLLKNNNNKIEIIYFFYIILGMTIGSFIYCIKL